MGFKVGDKIQFLKNLKSKNAGKIVEIIGIKDDNFLLYSEDKIYTSSGKLVKKAHTPIERCNRHCVLVESAAEWENKQAKKTATKRNEQEPKSNVIDFQSRKRKVDERKQLTQNKESNSEMDTPDWLKHADKRRKTTLERLKAERAKANKKIKDDIIK